jgi:hypothetical protein
MIVVTPTPPSGVRQPRGWRMSRSDVVVARADRIERAIEAGLRAAIALVAAADVLLVGYSVYARIALAAWRAGVGP